MVLETSGKWPDDREAMKRLKAAFYLRISRLLRSEFKLISVAKPDCLDVLLVRWEFGRRNAASCCFHFSGWLCLPAEHHLRTGSYSVENAENTGWSRAFKGY